jgi:uncharacterized membrane protein YwzB
MNETIDTALKRNRGYWFVDGFIEISAGGFFILLAGIILIRGYAAQSSLPSSFLSITGEIATVKLVGGVAVILILWWLKDHFTYPRTGYVRGNRITTAQVLIVIRNAMLFLLLPILGLVVLSLLIASTANVLSSMPAWFPAGVSLMWAAACIFAGEWMGLRRFRLLGGMILLSGIVICIWQFAIGLPEISTSLQTGILQSDVLEILRRTLSSLSVLMLVCGVFIGFSGVRIFLQYRKENPAPYMEEL